MRYIMLLIMLGICGQTAFAHEFLPTYPRLQLSYVPGVLHTEMELFNKREDIQYYEFSVWTEDWKRVPFATTDKIQQIGYLEKKRIDIYIREKDKHRAVYICSKSKRLKADETRTTIASRICSKIKD